MSNGSEWIKAAGTIHGWLYGSEPEILWDLATRSGYGDILEIGSWLGKSTIILAGAAKETGCVLYAIDSFVKDGTEKQRKVHAQDSYYGTFYRFIENMKRAKVYDSVIPVATMSNIAFRSLYARLKFAFIDGTHDYASVVADIKNVKEMVIPNGVIAVHDVSPQWPEVGLAVQEMLVNDEMYEDYVKADSIHTFRKLLS